MKNIVKFAVGNPVTICMIVFALLLLGKVSYDQLSVDLLPDLNNPRLFIELKVGERPPEEIEKQFVKNMESMAIRQSDVTQVSSVIKAGTARITVEYIWTKDMDEAFLDLQKAMNPFAQNKEITELKITQHDANLSPVVLVGMSHQNITDMAELRRIAESYIRNELIRLEGVAEVTLSGEEVTTLTVQTDFRAAARQEVPSEALQYNNQSISGGRVSELGLQYLVKSSSLFSTEADFENLIVGYKPVQQETSGNSSSETVTQEYKNALTKGLQYANQLHMSKKAIYDQLTSSYGEGFPADAAQYAIDNMTGVDWNANALAKAQEYYTGMSMSKSAVYDQLTSEYGEQFTTSEAQYAIDHLN